MPLEHEQQTASNGGDASSGAVRGAPVSEEFGVDESMLLDDTPLLEDALLDDTPLVAGYGPFDETPEAASDPASAALERDLAREEQSEGAPEAWEVSEAAEELTPASPQAAPEEEEASFAFPPAREQEEPSADDATLSDDTLDALLAAANAESVPDLAPENLAAAATGDSGELSQEDLEAIIAQAQRREVAPEKAAPPAFEDNAPAPEPPKPPRRRRLQWAASIAAAALTTVAVATVMQMQMGGIWSPWTELAPEVRLERAITQAEAYDARQEYVAAADVLAEALAEAPAEAPRRTEALYLYLDVLEESLPYRAESLEAGDLHQAIDAALDAESRHPDAPDALLWKARLYREEGMLHSAIDTYERLATHYPETDVVDDVLLEAAELSLEVSEPVEAAEYARRLLQEQPASQLGGEARLALADAYAMAGSTEDARTLYVRVAQSEPNTPLGALAYLRLGRMAFDQGRYAEAIHQLEDRLATSTTSEGNDEVYLLLARAYRETDQLQKAFATASDLVNFFPDSPVLPQAYVTLAKTLDELGNREEALRMAQLAAVQFPEDADVLRTKGELLGLTGNPYGAAEALLMADAACAKDPQLVLQAARYLKAAGMPDQALAAYEHLRERYAASYPALTGGIEQARLLFERDAVDEAVQQLEDLAVATRGSEQRPQVLLALGDLYHQLGLDTRAQRLAEEAAGLTEETQERAQAAELLARAGGIDGARKLLDDIDIDNLAEKQAYGLLSRIGGAMLRSAPREGLELLERAYRQYPEARTAEDDVKLLEAYLATDQNAAARRVVLELQQQVQQEPVDTVHLVSAAMRWGDHLYQRGDYTAAAEAYEMAMEASDAAGGAGSAAAVDPAWARFQLANALLKQNRFDQSLPLFDEIAASDAPWAQEASAKAEYARLERRLRGAPAEG